MFNQKQCIKNCLDVCVKFLVPLEALKILSVFHINTMFAISPRQDNKAGKNMFQVQGDTFDVLLEVECS